MLLWRLIPCKGRAAVEQGVIVLVLAFRKNDAPPLWRHSRRRRVTCWRHERRLTRGLRKQCCSRLPYPRFVSLRSSSFWRGWSCMVLFLLPTMIVEMSVEHPGCSTRKCSAIFCSALMASALVLNMRDLNLGAYRARLVAVEASCQGP